jgi:homoserine dehydrogenase
MHKILILGCGSVGGELISMINNSLNASIYCFARTKRKEYDNVKFIDTYKDLLYPDMVIETLPGKTNIEVQFAYSILKKYINNSVNAATCNKMLMYKNGKELCDMAKKRGSKLMLSSIISTGIMLDETNFQEYSDEELYKFRSKDGKATAKYIKQDIERIMGKI